MTHKAVNVLVSGRVQGVCYRASTRDQAHALGVAGWVRNLADGRVEAWLEGSPQQLEKMLGWMQAGPEHASVTGLEQTEQPGPGHQGFEVIR